MSDKMDEFLDKVDALCFEYGYEIHPTVLEREGEKNGQRNYKTITIIGRGEKEKVLYIDGDGRGK